MHRMNTNETQFKTNINISIILSKPENISQMNIHLCNRPSYLFLFIAYWYSKPTSLALRMAACSEFIAKAA